MSNCYAFTSAGVLSQVDKDGNSTAVEGITIAVTPKAGAAIASSIFLVDADGLTLRRSDGGEACKFPVSVAKAIEHNNKVFLPAASDLSVFVFDPLADAEANLERVDFTVEDGTSSSSSTPTIADIVICDTAFIVLLAQGETIRLAIADRSGKTAIHKDARFTEGNGQHLSLAAMPHGRTECLVETGEATSLVIDVEGEVRLATEGEQTQSRAARESAPAAGVAFTFPLSKAEPLECCDICFDDLTGGGVVTLDCGHAFHVECLTGCVDRAEGYVPKGQRIVFNMARCPGGCGSLIRHPVFPRSGLVLDRYNKVLADTAARAAVEYPGVKPRDAMDKYLHYVCHKCNEPFWGGNKDCAAMMNEPETDPALLVCEKCATDFVCSSHQRQFVVYKCQCCCRPANHLSFGHRRLCEECLYNKKTKPSDDGCIGAENGCPLKAGHATNGSYPVGCLACLEVSEFDVNRVKLFVAPEDDK